MRIRRSPQDVIALGECPEEEKAWLYRHAALVLYPTTFEGFGFIPFEAAEAGAPSLWADQSSMGDLLPSEHAGIVPWDVDASAANAARLIADAQAREALVTAVRAAAAELTWDRTAEQLLGVYRDAATAPRRVSAEPREALSDLAMSLVGPGGWLSPDDQLALLAVSTRPALKRTVFSALRSGYRAMYRARRDAARSGGERQRPSPQARTAPAQRQPDVPRRRRGVARDAQGTGFPPARSSPTARLREASRSGARTTFAAPPSEANRGPGRDGQLDHARRRLRPGAQARALRPRLGRSGVLGRRSGAGGAAGRWAEADPVGANERRVGGRAAAPEQPRQLRGGRRGRAEVLGRVEVRAGVDLRRDRRLGLEPRRHALPRRELHRGERAVELGGLVAQVAAGVAQRADVGDGDEGDEDEQRAPPGARAPRTPRAASSAIRSRKTTPG